MKQRNWVILVSVLIALNLITLGALWFSRLAGDQEFSPRKHEKFFRDKLNLRKEQLRLMRSSREKHFEKMEPLDKQMAKLKHDLFTSVDLTEQDENTLLVKLATNQRYMDSLTLIHFRELRALCDSSQLPAMNQLIENIIQQRFGPAGGKLPKRPGHGMPPP